MVYRLQIMKILPLSEIKLKFFNTSGILLHRYNIAQKPDTVELLKNSPNPFKKLTLATFKKLLKIKYTPEKLDGYYSTFIIDRLTGKPVTTYIKKQKFRYGMEKYEFYVKKRSGKLKYIGHRSFSVSEKKIDIGSSAGYMESYYNNRYRGLGIRGHQIAVERMQQTGAPNVMITSLPEAEPFHLGCGFEYNTNFAHMMSLSNEAKSEWNIFINSGQRILPCKKQKI